MGPLPDFTANFTAYGYQVIEQLGQNHLGGRVTYKALRSDTQCPVVIKQFRFATQADWSGYKAIQREIEVLKRLQHVGIPRYLDTFDPGDGICLVQEYKRALSLASPRYFNSEEVRQLALQILEILVYLQAHDPPIIHRDLKPENILVKRTQQLRVYLVDFGCAHVGEGTVAASSAVSGTMGFMPPEQILNQSLSITSDLYGLGVTLICLLTRTKSLEVSRLFDLKTFQIQLEKWLPDLNRPGINWFKKMVAPDPNDRFPNAQAALEALKTNPTFSPTESLWPKPSLLLAILVLLATTLLSSGFGLWLLLNQRSSTTSLPEPPVADQALTPSTPATASPLPTQPTSLATVPPTPSPTPVPSPPPPPATTTVATPTPATTTVVTRVSTTPTPQGSSCSSALGTLASSSQFQQSSTALYYCSSPGDYIGQGEEKLWGPVDGDFSAQIGRSGAYANSITIKFDGGSDYWRIAFAPPKRESLAVGTYEEAQRYAGQSPTKPGLSFTGSGRGCNKLYGSFVIYQIEYDASGEEILRFEAAFEQRCESESAPALVGQVRYDHRDSPKE